VISDHGLHEVRICRWLIAFDTTTELTNIPMNILRTFDLTLT
jgi:hypothetical protein